MKKISLLVVVFSLLFIVSGSTGFCAEPYRILIANDDGIESEGILALAKALEDVGSVTVVAPMKNYSGIGHGLTIDGPLMLDEIKREGKFFGYGVDATPATCVKIAIDRIVNPAPDLVVTGINAGINLGKILYVSGTFNAAQEAVMNGIPAVAFSLERGKKLDFTVAAEFAREFIIKMKKRGFPKNVTINVNIPAGSKDEIKGVKVTTLSDFQFTDVWTKRKTPWGKTYYWGKIKYPTNEPKKGSDHWALKEKIISITPVLLEYNNEPAMKTLSDFRMDF
ncbi:MAG: 5'/3'-nucleotidase SurE [Candidatus Riflebacteria bacterium]|nr:5'/3'-nucleotidase SurE [Candidatus Riflebacteria bacterium]